MEASCEYCYPPLLSVIKIFTWGSSSIDKGKQFLRDLEGLIYVMIYDIRSIILPSKRYCQCLVLFEFPILLSDFLHSDKF
jgi:hypothetical protein